MTSVNKVEKRHTACDECRARKLKCSGDKPQCERCKGEILECVYSVQKRMGRPRKRRRDDEEAPQEVQPDVRPEWDLNTTLPSNSFQSLTPGQEPNANELVSGLYPETDWINDANADAGFAIDPIFSNPLASTYDISTLPFDGVEGNAFGKRPEPNFQAPAPPPKQSAPLSISSNTDPPPPCSCLSSSYATLAKLQSISDFQFPYSLPPLRAGLSTTSSVLSCQVCAQEPAAAVQNMFLLTGLLTSITERMHKIAQCVSTEAARAKANGEVKKVQLSDDRWEGGGGGFSHAPPQPNSQVAPGDGFLPEPARFELELSGDEWRFMAKKAFEYQIIGSDDKPETLLGILALLEHRQLERHKNHELVTATTNTVGCTMSPNEEAGDYTCLRLVNNVRRMISATPWQT